MQEINQDSPEADIGFLSDSSDVSSDSSDILADLSDVNEEIFLKDFISDFIQTVLETAMNSKQITEMLKLFNRHKIGLNMPLSSRTLLKTPRNTIIRQVSGMDYYNFETENQILQNLNTYYPNYKKIILI